MVEITHAAILSGARGRLARSACHGLDCGRSYGRADGATADDVAWTTHPHPTLPEAALEAALGFRDAAVHIQPR